MKTMKNLLSFILLFFLSFSIIAQNATIKGIITDTNGEALISATIAAGDAGTVSDIDGRYTLNVPAGIQEVEASYVGYQTLTQKVTLSEGQVVELNIQLSEEATLLQTATVTSGKFEKPLSEVTVSLDILKPELIESNNANAVDAILDKIPGVSIVDGQANIRGGSGYSYGAGSRVMLLVDDIPALQADAGFPNWGDIAVENVEQIEVVKGAASALYGSAALNGIINVRTGYAKSKPVTKAAVFYTSYLAPEDTNKQWWKETDRSPFLAGASFLHKQKFGKLDFVSSAYYQYQDSWNKDVFQRYGRITLGARYRITDRLAIGFNGNVNTGHSQDFFYWLDGGANAMLGTEGTYSRSVKTRYFVDPFATYFDNKGNKHKLLGRIYSVNNQVSNNRSNMSDLYYGEYQFQRQFEESKLVLTAGLVGSTTNINAELYGGDEFQSQNYAAYAQVDKKFFDKLNVSAGVRYENNQISAPDSVWVGVERQPAGTASDGKPIFRFGLNYQMAEFTFLRASWGQGYRFPTIAEKFISTNVGFDIFPSPSLQSETGWSAEIGLKQGFKISEWAGFLDVAAYWSRYFDMMEFTLVNQGFNFAFQSQNIGNTDIKGFDISVMGQGKLFGLPTNLITGYTYIDPQFQEFTEADERASSVDFNILKYRNKHSFKIDIESKISAFSIGLAGLYNSNVVAIDNLFNIFIPGLEEYREINNKGYFLFDVRLGYQINEHFKISVLGKNLLNQEYTNRPALIEAPRNISGRLEMKF